MKNSKFNNSNKQLWKYFLFINIGVIILSFFFKYLSIKYSYYFNFNHHYYNDFYYGQYDQNFFNFIINELYQLYAVGLNNTQVFFNILSRINILHVTPFINIIYSYIVNFFYNYLFVLYVFDVLVGLGINYLIAKYWVLRNLKSSDNKSSNLTIANIIKNSFKITSNHGPSIFVATLLLVLTIWIPYINVGAMIGYCAFIVALSKGKNISATSIFNSKHRKYIVEFCILTGLTMLGILIGSMFVIIPGLVIAYACLLAPYIFVDKKSTPLESIKLSNKILYSKKLTIFITHIIMYLIYSIIFSFVRFLSFTFIDNGFVDLIIIVALIPFSLVFVSSYIYIYQELSPKLTEE